jgi:uncharacterized protein DUF6492
MCRTVDLVLPVNPAAQDDGRRMRICLSSLASYLDPASVGRLLIVIPDRVPKASVTPLTWDGRTVPFETRVLHDREILGQNAWRERVGGWYTQQFVKLGAADHLQSEFYITLDSDVFLTRPTCFDDLIRGGRAITTEYPRKVHDYWWTASAQVLGTDARLDQDGMGVTPAVLSVNVARGLLRYLEARYAGPWYRGVVEYLDDQKARGLYNPAAQSSTPTEYTLYYLFAEKQGWVGRYHVKSESLWCPQQIFRPEELQALGARLLAARAGAGRFFVLQSVLGMSPEWVWDRVSVELGLMGYSGGAGPEHLDAAI